MSVRPHVNRALTPKQILAVPCPTCGADTNKSCEPTSHELGAEEHRERCWAASDKRIFDEVNQVAARMS
jgi:hypothetical protein